MRPLIKLAAMITPTTMATREVTAKAVRTTSAKVKIITLKTMISTTSNNVSNSKANEENYSDGYNDDNDNKNRQLQL